MPQAIGRHVGNVCSKEHSQHGIKPALAIVIVCQRFQSFGRKVVDFLFGLFVV